MKLNKLAFVLPIALSLTLAACGGNGGTVPSTQAEPASGTTPLSPMSTTISGSLFSSTIAAEGPTAYYHLDDTGSTAADASGHGLNGSIGSSVSKGAQGLLSSVSDTAIGTPGIASSGGVVKVAQNSQLQPSSAVSVEAFLKFTSTPADYTVPVEYGQRSGNAPYGWYFKSGHLIAQFTLSTGVIDIQTPSALAPNTAYDVVSTYDGASAKLYVNGSLVASASKSGTLADYVSGYGLTIGGAGNYSSASFKGTIDEVAVYAGKALTAAQVSSNHHAATTVSSATASPAPTATPGATATATPAPVKTATPAPVKTATPVSSSSVHYLDDTGCQDFPAGDFWNRPVDGATVRSNSSTEISWAASQSGSNGAPQFNSHYDYEVVSPSMAEHAVSSTSSHKIPANVESPAQSGWPEPSDMGTLEPTGDKVSVLVQETNPPADCRGWDGYSFSGSSTSWSAYSGDHVEMNQNMPAETCNGVASLCGEDLEGDLTYYELNANSGNASGTVTHPILHAIHTELPCADAGTCGSPPANAFNQSFNCRTSCARLRLKASAIARPSDPNAAALYDAMVHYGLDSSENGGHWGFYTLWRADDPGYPSTIPSAVSSFIGSLRMSDFEVLNNGSW